LVVEESFSQPTNVVDKSPKTVITVRATPIPAGSKYLRIFAFILYILVKDKDNKLF
jgi:hypothetical protein